MPLRRGFYAHAAPYASAELNPAELANALHAPSYLSTLWALGYYGIIPERVVTFTSVTSRSPRTFENSLGVFRYQHVKPSAFFGYRLVQMGGRPVLIAAPEKALLDLWYLEKGQWGRARMTEMRFQNFEIVDAKALESSAARFGSRRIAVAVEEWKALVRRETAGVREL
jgi:hypothetical protein